MKSIILTFVSFVLSVPAHPDAGGPFDPDRARPVCHMDEVNSCISSNQNAANDSRSLASSIDPQIQIVQDSLKPLDDLIRKASAKIEALQTSVKLSATEIEFTRQKSAAPAASIFGGFPAVEDFFSLQTTEKNWGDRYPAERAQWLSEGIEEGKAEADAETTQMAATQQKFASLNQQLAALQSRKSAALSDASQHASMCQTGCRQQFCPGFR